MRWVYTTPERKEFVSDGTKIYWYIPEDRQVTVRDVPPEDQATSPELFLSGKGDIARDFTASYVETSSPGTVALKLVPRRPEPQYEHLVVTLDPATMQIRGLTTRDRQGGESALTFTNMQENTGLSDNEFVFRIPRGVTVVTDDRR
jgi:outer membrane lipoprotein carrier protein